MKNRKYQLLLLCAVCLLVGFRVDAQPASDNAGLKLPAGFHATVFADDVGQPRHIVVTSQGNVYVKLANTKDGKGILELKDTNRDGKGEVKNGFGDYGGTGMALKDGYLYASSDTDVYRYKLNAQGEVIDPQHPEHIVTGLVDKNEHSSKSIILDNAGNIYVNIGAYSNACQEKDRTKGSPGMMPCPILKEAGGIWQFKADKLNQSYPDGIRYVTGMRNVVGLDWNIADNQLFLMMHGRDQLSQLYPQYFTDKQSAELPAETMFAVNKGDNLGWPYTYYDQFQKKKILAPEYGGDGQKTGAEDAIDPVMAFPGHLAPNGLLFYTGSMFPDHYKNGAFIAFHGSWNRAPEPQKGYFVVFVPFNNGKPSGDWETFADDFAGVDPIQSPGQAKHRPCGLAQGPDGALYVTDDTGGTIYKITYHK